MARDYKSYSSKKSKRDGHSKVLPIVVVLMVIILLLIAGFHKLSQRKLTENNQTTTKEQIQKKQTKADATADNVTQEPQIKFEFYSILQNEKVVDGSDATTQPTTPAAAAKANEKANTDAANKAGPKATAPVTSGAKPVTLNSTVVLPAKKSVSRTDANSYSVQVVSVRNSNDAKTISNKLKSDGFSVQVLEIKIAETQWYRVQVGPYHSLDDALNAQMTLRKNNYHAILLKPQK